MEKSLNTCPSLQQIELLAIDDSQLNAELQAHLKSCPNCKSQYEELVRFYQILQDELATPISNSVVSFFQEIQAGEMLISVLQLCPLSSEAAVQPTFRCNLVFQHLKDTAFIDFPEIDSDEILLRMLQDSKSLEGCAVLFARKPGFYRNIKLFFPNLNLIIAVNSNGIGKINPINAQLLANQMVELIP